MVLVLIWLNLIELDTLYLPKVSIHWNPNLITKVIGSTPLFCFIANFDSDFHKIHLLYEFWRNKIERINQICGNWQIYFHETIHFIGLQNWRERWTNQILFLREYHFSIQFISCLFFCNYVLLFTLAALFILII